MQKLFDHQNFYLVGIKGVAMTSTAQLLIDAGKNVSGSDVAEDFVTKEILDDLPIKINVGFEDLPDSTECVVYTSAHNGVNNHQVQLAIKKGLPVFSQAEALAEFFNVKKGIAVSGVGGKSTVSAMISWILEKVGKNPSYSVGVGNIPGLDKTGVWRDDSDIFVAEADEYVVNPHAPESNQEIIPRFSFLKPSVTVCTNLEFDHPDVYRDFDHTKAVYLKFFENLKEGGSLIVNQDDKDLMSLVKNLNRPDINIITFGEDDISDYELTSYSSKAGITKGSIVFDNTSYDIELSIPGKFNLRNALSAVVACHKVGVPIENATNALKTFRSTMRRFEFVGEINGVKCYDDYAHHPHEVYNAIQALNEWYPESRKIIAFQSHTYSRTKQLFDDFVDAFREAKEVVMINIFSSAREKADPTVSSDVLCEAISKKYPNTTATNVKTLQSLAKYFEDETRAENVILTLGAGDIYQVFEILKKH